MRHQKVFLVEKEWDDHHVPNEVKVMRLKKIVLGYNTLEKAQEFCVIMNKECGNCPRRAALHTTYKVIDNPIHVRVYNADETYEQKMGIK